VTPGGPSSPRGVKRGKLEADAESDDTGDEDDDSYDGDEDVVVGVGSPTHLSDDEEDGGDGESDEEDEDDDYDPLDSPTFMADYDDATIDRLALSEGEEEDEGRGVDDLLLSGSDGGGGSDDPDDDGDEDADDWYEHHKQVRHRLDVFDWGTNMFRARINSQATQVYCRQRSTMAASVVGLRAWTDPELGPSPLAEETAKYVPKNKQHFTAFLKECVPRTRLRCAPHTPVCGARRGRDRVGAEEGDGRLSREDGDGVLPPRAGVRAEPAVHASPRRQAEDVRRAARRGLAPQRPRLRAAACAAGCRARSCWARVSDQANTSSSTCRPSVVEGRPCSRGPCTRG